MAFPCLPALLLPLMLMMVAPSQVMQAQLVLLQAQVCVLALSCAAVVLQGVEGTARAGWAV